MTHFQTRAAVLASLLWTAPCLAGEAEQRAQVADKYRTYWHDLRGYYESISLSAHIHGKRYTRAVNYNYRFLAQAPMSRLDEFDYESTPGQLVRVAHPRLPNLTVYRKTLDAPFVLVQTQPPNPDRLQIFRPFAPLPFAAYCVFDQPLDELLDRASLTVDSVAAGPEPETVTMTLSWPVGQSERLQASVTLDGRRSWAITACEEGVRGSLKRRSRRIEYENDPSRIRLPKRLIETSVDANGMADPSHHFVVEVREIAPGPVPEREFTLAAFGLSDAGLQPFVPPWYYLQLVAVVALVLGVILRWWLRRCRKVGAPPLET